MLQKWLPLLLLAAVVGCAGTGRGNASGMARNVGTATAPDLIDGVQRVLTLHQFEIQQSESPPNIYIETHWRSRRPFEDEAMAGVSSAQIRAIVRARPRSVTTTMGDLFTVDLSIEQRVRVDGSMDWITSRDMEGARAYADRITEDLRRELDVGVRRF